jgi:hypothetical protein
MNQKCPIHQVGDSTCGSTRAPAVLVAPLVALPGKVQPLGVPKLIAHEVEPGSPQGHCHHASKLQRCNTPC